MASLFDMFDPETLNAMKELSQVSEQEKRAAAMNAMGRAGFSMLANNYGPNSRVAFSRAIGSGGMEGMDSYQDSLQQTAKQRMGEFQNTMSMQKFMDGQKQARARQQFLNSAPDVPPEVRAGVVPFDDWWKRQNPEDQYKVINSDLVKVGPQGATLAYRAEAKEAARPWYVNQVDGRTVIDPAYADLERTKASFARPPAQPMQPIAYVDKEGRTVWGTIAEARGMPAANFNPSIKGQVAEATAFGSQMGKDSAEAKSNLPKAISNGEEALQQIKELRSHPGLNQAVGKSSLLQVQRVPGTDAYDFMNRLDQLKGGAFLTAFETLKGGGQITEIEGKKATDAIARMNNATSEKEFNAALNDYERVIGKAVSNAKLRAGNRKQDDPLGIR
jgi:hypothetical protein